MRRVKRKKIVLRRFGPLVVSSHTKLMTRSLCRERIGRMQAWVWTGSNGWSQKPGFSKLFFSRVEHPGSARRNLVNVEATRLLSQANSEPCNTRTRLLAPDAWVMETAYLADAATEFEKCYKMHCDHFGEIEAYIAEHYADEFYLLGEPSDDFRCYLMSEYGFNEGAHREALEEDTIDLPAAEIDRLVGLHRGFPVYVRFRWT